MYSRDFRSKVNKTILVDMLKYPRMYLGYFRVKDRSNK